MQTFLPFPSFADSAACLDRQRLGKQRVEAYQILRALEGRTRGWVSHPCTKMWRGYEHALALYGLVVCAEWTSRGYVDNLAPQFRERLDGVLLPPPMPPWLGREDLHRSHRSQLLAKSEFYAQYEWTEGAGAHAYVWPTPEQEVAS